MSRCLITLLCLLCGGSCGQSTLALGTRLRVGVYQNEPKVFLGADGQPAGFHIDILQDIAREEGWSLDYVPGTWAECLDRLAAEEIDLLVDIAYSEERDQLFDFNREVILYNWARLYARAGVRVNDLFDLDGRTIAVVEGDVSYSELRSMLERFGIGSIFLEVASFEDVFSCMQRHEADVGLISRLFGLQHERAYDVNKTFLVVYPARLHVAAPKGKHQDILAAIDRRLAQLKADQQSIYYQALDRWIGESESAGIPAWISYAVAGAIAAALLLAAFSLALRRQVRTRTAELAQANRELARHRGRLECEVQERTAELTAANQELQAFAYSASHDLRAPLRAIDGFSRVLLEDCSRKLEPPELDSLQRIVRQTKQMSNLIDALLDLSRVTSSEMRLERTNLSDMAREIGARLRETQPEHAVEFIVGEDLMAWGDARLLGRALENLLSNAWKFTRTVEHPRIELGASNQARGVVFYVRDNGVGLDMQYRDKLFAPFQRLHGQEAFPGTGIGLSTVHRIITRHGGQIWCESEVGKGTTFYFTLRPAPSE